MRNKGVVYYASYHDAIRPLSDGDRLKVYDAVFDYGLRGTEPNLPAHLNGYFLLMKPNIDSSQSRYKAAVENGGKPPKEGSNPRGRPPKNQNINQTENQNINQTENQNINLNKEIDTDIDINTDINSKKEKEVDGESLRGETAEDDWNEKRNRSIALLDQMKGEQK